MTRTRWGLAPRATTALLGASLALAACNGSKDDGPEPFVPDIETDETDIAFTGDTGSTGQPTPETTLEIHQFLHATATAGVRFSGWWGYYLQIRGEPRPGCIIAWRATDWPSDPAREGLAERLSPEQKNLCVDCDFTFTVSMRSPRRVERFPWFEEEADTGDTDPVPDTAGTIGGEFGCDDLDALAAANPGAVVLNALASPEPDPWFGYGFRTVTPGATEDDADVGEWMLWDQSQAIWGPLTYDATFTGNVLESGFQSVAYGVQY